MKESEAWKRPSAQVAVPLRMSVLTLSCVTRRSKVHIFGRRWSRSSALRRSTAARCSLVPYVDTNAHSGDVFLCISERHQGKVQLAVGSVRLIVFSTATICIHFKQTDGTYLESVLRLPNRSNCLWRCIDLRCFHGWACRLPEYMYLLDGMLTFYRKSWSAPCREQHARHVIIFLQTRESDVLKSGQPTDATMLLPDLAKSRPKVRGAFLVAVSPMPCQ